MASITHCRIYSQQNILLEVNTVSLFIQKKERKKKFELEQSSW